MESRSRWMCKLAVRLKHRQDEVLEGVPMDCVRLPSKIAEARERAKRRNTSSSRRRKAVPIRLAPPHLETSTWKCTRDTTQVTTWLAH